ncbi:acyl-phosphate glycerol 3-phosphate acyltransferase [Lampropedia cohaerens]|uniref:Acyl-phosphate glycerol 3-phosphate acyltransferase n=1 Tax=Lampropedia cohaerens TaxID=1610491 RepID=A0A0U1Q3H4_9BURK|nr:lysophospholipid acyltransferase family protein [Lampropedia cohaerens]KKW69296.1 acyl-phosphate glycerol 3-phosphate acyltransferase [Lampropedia cohaerens]
MTFRQQPLRFLTAAVRSWLHLLVMGISMLGFGTVLFIVAIFRKGEPIYRIGVAWLAVCVSSAKWMLGIRYVVHGLENVPARNSGVKVVVLAKHQSTYDTFVMPLILREQVLSYVFKKELLSIPIFGWGMRRMDMVHIDRAQREKALHKVLSQGRALLAQGNWVIMFPEGTRVPRGQVGSYKSSGARLAIEADAVILPVAIASARCWPPRAIVKQAGVVDISFGPPIATKGRKAQAVMDEVQDWIESEMRRIDPQAYTDGQDAR